jgi:predicted HAD superfamily Cof-like phosphohydrolase
MDRFSLGRLVAKMSDVFNDQKKFMQACGQSTAEYNADQFGLYVDLIKEEAQELSAAIAAVDTVEQLDALIDILVVTVGALHSLGVDVDGAWKEVMRSNFDKVDTRTGRVTKRADGKVLKPENWEPPRLAPFVRTR